MFHVLSSVRNVHLFMPVCVCLGDIHLKSLCFDWTIHFSYFQSVVDKISTHPVHPGQHRDNNIFYYDAIIYSFECIAFFPFHAALMALALFHFQQIIKTQPR